MVFCVPPETPPARCAVLPFQGRLVRDPRLPNGGAVSPQGLTEGVLFDEWQQLKITNDTPFAAARHETEV